MGDNIANQRKRILDVIGPSGRVTNLANVQYNTDTANIYATNFIGNFDGTFAVGGVDRGVIFKDGNTINSAPNFFYTDAGDVRIDSNLTVLGNFTVIGSNNTVLSDPIFEIASNVAYGYDTGYMIQRPAGNVVIGHLASGVYENVLVMSYTDNSAYNTSITPDTSKNLEVQVIGNVTANYYSGNASQLISLTGAAAGTYGGTIDNHSANIAVMNVDSTGKITSISNVTFTVVETSTLAQVVNRGNATSNTVLFQNADVAFITTASVGIANSAPGHTLSIGSNIYFDVTGSNTFVTTANISAPYVTSNGKYLTDTTDATPGVYGGLIGVNSANIAIVTIGPDGRLESVTNATFTVSETTPTLAQVVNRGNVTSNTVQFTNAKTSFVTSSNVGIGNSAPDHLLSLGEGEIFFNGNVVVLGSGDNISIGTQADQESNAIAIGTNAGKTSQHSNTVAIGLNAGKTAQEPHGVAIGDRAGENNQQESGISIGEKAGQSTQGSYSVAIGKHAGQTNQGSNAIAIGRLTASAGQGDYAIAIGDRAGVGNQGANSIAIGKTAGVTSAHANTIILNASGAPLNSVVIDSVYIKNFRNSTIQYTNVLSSNITSGEVVTSSIVVSGSNVGIGGNTNPQHGLSVHGNTYSNIITQIIRFNNGAAAAAIEGLTFLDVTQNGNTTTETIIFNNAITSLVTASNVGIANTNPQDTLAVNGNAYISGLIRGDGGLLSNTVTVVDMTSNSTRISSLEVDMTSNSTRISNFEGAITVNTSTGSIGLGRSTPYARLEVAASAGDTTAAASRYFKYDSDVGDGSSVTFNNISIFAVEDILTNQWIASHAGTMTASDRRIKSNIIDISDTDALEKLRLLQPKTYTYKDVVSRGSDSVIGFIAQDVQDTLPEATGTRTDFIPNVYELANVSQSNIITFTNFNTANLESNSTTIKLKTIDDTDKIVTIAEVVDSHSIQTNEDLGEFDQVFVYGQKVDDFIFLKKDAIFTITTAAVQELDRKHQLLEDRILALEQQINSS